MFRFVAKPGYIRPDKLGVASLLAAAVFSTGLAGCGGSSSGSTSSTAAATSTSTSTTTTMTSSTQSQGAASVTSGSVRGALRGENHAPKVKQSWRYSVVVSDAAGHPLSGTVDIEFAFAGQVVGRDTPPTHPVVDGHWDDTIEFPADAIGMPLSLQAVVHTRLGSITLDWPVTVSR
jgi:hypothetical protein